MQALPGSTVPASSLTYPYRALEIWEGKLRKPALSSGSSWAALGRSRPGLDPLLQWAPRVLRGCAELCGRPRPCQRLAPALHPSVRSCPQRALCQAAPPGFWNQAGSVLAFLQAPWFCSVPPWHPF